MMWLPEGDYAGCILLAANGGEDNKNPFVLA